MRVENVERRRESAVLITGATGNVGSRLLEEYLERTDAPVWVLVRAASQAEAERRVEGVLDFWGVRDEPTRSRVRVLRGDILLPDLGLSERVRSEVRENVGEVVHAASNLRLDMSIERARLEILGGTQNVYALARECRHLCRFGYCSTQEIMGRYAGVVREEFLTDYGIPFINNYERAKFECEEWLRGEIQEGAPVTIFRIAMVVGESRSGRLLRFQSFYMLTEKLILDPEVRLLPKDAFIDTIPVDFLASVMVRLMDAGPAEGRIYHLSQGDEDAVDFRSYRARLRPLVESRLGAPLKRTMLLWSGLHRALYRVLAMLTTGRLRRYFRVQLIFLAFFGLKGRFVNTRTRADVEALGLDWPRFDDYLPKLMDYYLEHRAQARMPF